MRNKAIVFVALICCLFFPAAAHSGRTDSRGGHRDHSTGEYHYHHGYPAHQHTNGSCPYDFDDRTGWNSGTSGASTNSNKPESVADPPAMPDLEEKKEERSILFIISSVFICSYVAFLLLCTIIGMLDGISYSFKNKSKEKQRIAETKAKYVEAFGGKSISECSGMPSDVEIGADGLPKERGAEGWGQRYTFYVSPSGKSYHCRHGCSNARTQIHACHVLSKNLAPCRRCDPQLPDLDWYAKYHQIERIKRNYNID